jgi:hypothetical protein
MLQQWLDLDQTSAMEGTRDSLPVWNSNAGNGCGEEIPDSVIRCFNQEEVSLERLTS